MIDNNNRKNILEIDDLRTSYEFKTIIENKDYYVEIEILHGLCLSVQKGEIVALLSANGAGKTTLMRSIMGLMDEYDGNIMTGNVIFDGDVINNFPTEKIVRAGLILVPEGKLLFPTLSVADNLALGSHTRSIKDHKQVKIDTDNVYRLFPILKEKRKHLANTLSGGQAQMLALGRGLLSHPRVLLLDEPCLGLAPLLVKEVMNSISRLRDELGISILLSEQNARAALGIADRCYLLKEGEIIADGSVQEFMDMDMIKNAYLGK